MSDGGFDTAGFLRGLDAIFAEHRGPTDAEPYLREALARTADDPAARLTVLNELMGFYRSVSRHDASTAAAREALALADSLGLAGTDAYATTLINVATALRAAGRHEEARDAYSRALADAARTMGPADRRLAALHNNLSILHSETGAHADAARELEAALAILEASTVDPGADLDIATTLTNLALVEFTLERPGAAARAERSMEIYARGGHERNPHYAAALAGHGEASLRMGRPDDAVVAYREALAVIAECYGRDTEAYAVTEANLREAEAALAAAAPSAGRAAADAPVPSGSRASSPSAAPASSLPDIRGLELARRYWEEHGRPMLEERHQALRGRVAVGLVGHGSDCYGFDDAASRDHDFGPGFCLWLTAEDHATHGEALQADYDALPREFLGFPARVATPRADGEGRRVGVFEIGAFFEGLTGHRTAPATAHEWLMLDEATLAAATNGAVFADPRGAFSGVRNAFRRMPEDVRLALVSRRLGMVAQAGQYNLPRMLDRGDGAAAWLAVGEYVNAAASLVFLLNGPSAVGYLPYYKWRFAALRDLAGRPASRLAGVGGRLEDAQRLASAACFGGAGFGEGGEGAGPARAALEASIADACALIAEELRAQRLSRSDAEFLEHHRTELARGIRDPWLASL